VQNRGRFHRFLFGNVEDCCRKKKHPARANNRLKEFRMEESRRLPPVWLMGLTNAPFGLMGGFAVVAVPEMLAAQGVPGGHIAAITAAIISPSFWAFVFAPMLDVWLSRRTYALIFAVLSALAIGYTAYDHSRPGVVEAVMIAGYVAATLYQGAAGGWMGSLIRKADDSTLGIWFAVGNTGAGGLMMLSAGPVVHRFPPIVAALLLGGAALLPTLLFLAIPAPGPDRTLASESFGRFWREVFSLVKDREVVVALALFLLPAASFALTNVLAGIGKDFSTSEATVSLFAGVGSVIAGLVGSFLLKPLASRFKLRPIYLGIGIAGGVFTTSLLLLPRAPWSFGLAVTGENLFQALAFAAGNAITFEVIGPQNPLSATLFTLLNSAVNLPIIYMSWLDGRGYDWRSVPGSFLTDAGISIAACLLLSWAIPRWRRAAA
jgi:PAT family beta-lactamase induction signal transducer AmpG